MTSRPLASYGACVAKSNRWQPGWSRLGLKEPAGRLYHEARSSSCEKGISLAAWPTKDASWELAHAFDHVEIQL